MRVRTELYRVCRKVIGHRVLRRTKCEIWPALEVEHAAQERTLMTLRSFSGPLTPRIDSLCNNCTSSYQLEPSEKRSVKPCNAPIKPLNRLKVRGILT